MKSKTFVSGGLIGLSALGLWLSSQRPWLTVSTIDDKAGPTTTDLVGAVWAPAMTSIALALLAALFATTIMGSLGRRIVGALAAVLAIAASWTPMVLLSGGEDGVDGQRALDLLTSGSASQRASDAVTVSDWAQINAIEIHALGPVLALVSCALALVGAVLMVRNPGAVKKQKSSAYETPEVRRQRITEDLKEDGQSGRVLWDALDAGVDPTDMDQDLADQERDARVDEKTKE
ncbi:MAG: TIGR02234 family membrane protein [Corynebacterium sp.]|uniref:TIGR02234 family membrane protein n=1 Tax=Corynebacterium sp. TaxID=1720 RepID=UPI0026DB8051|nr:TIGR02234 family membrane protein [Corynebacterium sp.]MDO5029564.1 TIGR02234 family membrane protein [Corynebacterium sp.]